MFDRFFIIGQEFIATDDAELALKHSKKNPGAKCIEYTFIDGQLTVVKSGITPEDVEIYKNEKQENQEKRSTERVVKRINDAFSFSEWS